MLIERKLYLYSNWLDQGFLLPDEHIDKKLVDSALLFMNKRIKKSHLDIHNWHIRSSSIFKMCSNIKILNYLKIILGRDINIWRSVLFLKNGESRKSDIPWHQDNALWELSPQITASVWVALDDIDVHNGCIQLIPGTHFNSYEHFKKVGIKFNHQVDNINQKLLGKVINISRKKGQFLVFNENILHRSLANESVSRRAAICFRYTVPCVKILNPQPALVSVSGSDKFNFSKHWKLDK